MTEDNRVHFDLNDLLHPAQAFSHPSEVVNDPDLTLNEKRAILASWASDACAIEAAPALRSSPSGAFVRRCEAWTNKLTVTDTAAPYAAAASSSIIAAAAKAAQAPRCDSGGGQCC